jgi:NADH-quinone oxidoreductase subunit C
MSERLQDLAERLGKRFGDAVSEVGIAYGELTAVVSEPELLQVCTVLRDDPAFGFEQLSDVCGVDYLHHGVAEWATEDASSEGFSRGVAPTASARFSFHDAPPEPRHSGARYAVVYHLLSMQHNLRLRLKVMCPDDEYPSVDSVNSVWSSANWFEREAFDLFGIVFKGHPDLRRILTDYGFVGHAFRKDFPLVGHVEMRYDPEQARVIYEPVSIEPRVLVPKVIRDDHRYVDTAESDDA